MAAYYAWIKTVHVTAVAVSLLLFLLRGWWAVTGSPRAASVWARRVPHYNDAVLLAAGLALAAILHQYPLVDAWLTAKLAGLLAHIGLGWIAVRGPGSRPVRAAAWAASIAAFGYVAAVALTRDPSPWA
ncbi:SirB2 family protein [Inmirania thermothiophila]|uniref:Putative membrane protein SirB2 n=1 Tax=Inmirania thermothiophila TaxID=1750597 RepID=A0A3N1XS95_9GAMM|nr:SirB2 family protein [Inmirania thermothiophila]ROR29505.1 putative membrane protein SirB2 [Inmirania thermothiophila]